MGQKAALQASVRDALHSLGDARTTIVLRGQTVGVFNPATGQTAITTADQSVFAVLSGFSNAEIDGEQVRRDDLRARVVQADLKTPPDRDAKVLIGSATYQVVRVAEDPARATWAIQLRSP